EVRQSDVTRQQSRATNLDAVRENANLDVSLDSVVAMDHCVGDRFAQYTDGILLHDLEPKRSHPDPGCKRIESGVDGAPDLFHHRPADRLRLAHQIRFGRPLDMVSVVLEDSKRALAVK